MTNSGVDDFYYLETRQKGGEAGAGVEKRWRKRKKHPVEFFCMCINFRGFSLPATELM